MLKAQLSFCSKLPRDVMDSAQMNSLKSMVPSLFLSKVLKACWANLEASPYGKNCEGEGGGEGHQRNIRGGTLKKHQRNIKETLKN